MPIQGTAADIIKIAMIKVYDRLKAENLKAKIIMQVHDEIIVEAAGVLPYISMITDNDLAIWDDKYIEGLSKLVNAVHNNGAKIGIQINHAGRKCESVKTAQTKNSLPK